MTRAGLQILATRRCFQHLRGLLDRGRWTLFFADSESITTAIRGAFLGFSGVPTPVWLPKYGSGVFPGLGKSASDAFCRKCGGKKLEMSGCSNRDDSRTDSKGTNNAYGTREGAKATGRGVELFQICPGIFTTGRKTEDISRQERIDQATRYCNALSASCDGDDGHIVFVNDGYHYVTDVDPSGDLQAAISDVVDSGSGTQNYIKMNLIDADKRKRRSNTATGNYNEVKTVLAFGLDVDLNLKAGGEKYASFEEAMGALEAMPVPPSMIVGSGGGLHVYWFITPTRVDDPDVKAELAAVAVAWEAAYRLELGKEIDKCSDLTRLYRIPGGSRKASIRKQDSDGNFTGEVEQVEIVQELLELHKDRRYSWQVIRDTVPGLVEEPVSKSPKAKTVGVQFSSADAPRVKPELPTELSVSEDFNRRADWYTDVLDGTGWERVGNSQGRDFLRRPGKKTGHSATIGNVSRHGTELFTNFSSSAGLQTYEKCRNGAKGTFSKFGLFAALRCGVGKDGQPTRDAISQASAELAKQGYGRRANSKDYLWAWLTFKKITVVDLLAARGFARDGDKFKMPGSVDLVLTRRESQVGVLLTDVDFDGSEIIDPEADDIETEVKAVDSEIDDSETDEVEQSCTTGEYVSRNQKYYDREDLFSLFAFGGNVARARAYVEWSLIPDDPPKVNSVDKNEAARFLLQELSDCAGNPLIAWHNSQWYQYDGGFFAPAGDEKEFERELKALIFDRFTNVSEAFENTVIDHVKTLARRTEVGAWRGTPPVDWDPKECITARDCIMQMHSGATIPSTPRFFATSGVATDLTPGVPQKIEEWLKFLDSIWGDDKQSIKLLQQWLGYCLTDDDRHHKLLLLLGPKRAGKGTIFRLLEKIVGSALYSSSSLDQIAGEFGMEPLIGKRVCVCPDERFSGNPKIVGKLLSLSGGDVLGVNRKSKTIVNVRPKIRLMVGSNAMPHVRDDSGAIASRFLILEFKKSFVGCEDKDLDAKLHKELGGIVRWALQGLRDLNEAGKFVEPRSSRMSRSELVSSSSPLSDFVRELYEFTGDECDQIRMQDLFKDYRRWAEGRIGRPIEDLSIFARNLRSAFPDLETARISRKKINTVLGIKPIHTSDYFADFVAMHIHDGVTRTPLADIERAFVEFSGDEVFDAGELLTAFVAEFGSQCVDGDGLVGVAPMFNDDVDDA